MFLFFTWFLLRRLFMLLFFCCTAGTWSEETSDCYVFPDSQWHGVSHQAELYPQRSSYKKLHVSTSLAFLGSLGMRLVGHLSNIMTDVMHVCDHYCHGGFWKIVLVMLLFVVQDWCPFCDQDNRLWSLGGCVCQELLQTGKGICSEAACQVDGSWESAWWCLLRQDWCG